MIHLVDDKKNPNPSASILVSPTHDASPVRNRRTSTMLEKSTSLNSLQSEIDNFKRNKAMNQQAMLNKKIELYRNGRDEYKPNYISKSGLSIMTGFSPRKKKKQTNTGNDLDEELERDFGLFGNLWHAFSGSRVF